MAFPLDLTFPLDGGTPRFPGDPEIRIDVVRSLERGDPYRLSRVALGSHSGTHLDAPSHFLPQAPTLDDLDLRAVNGPAWVLVLGDEISEIGPRELAGVPPGIERLLIRTRNSAGWERGSGFDPDFVALTPEAAELLVPRRLRLVGVDGLSVESDPERSFPVHRRLLGAGIWILEGLRLAGATPGAHELGCLPIRLRGADGGPCRAVLWS